MTQAHDKAQLDFKIKDSVLELFVMGEWDIYGDIPELDIVETMLSHHSELKTLSLNVENLNKWDSSLVSFLYESVLLAKERGICLAEGNLPNKLNRLVSLATASPEMKNARPREHKQHSFVEKVGLATIECFKSGIGFVDFLGRCTLSVHRLICCRTQMRFSDFALVVQECGANALPIVTLIAALTGLIMAFVGALQLEQFGAQVYVANLVGIAMIREMGALMVGVIMAGRTGAAFAATIGSMKVSEELDALKTFAINPIDFVVLPRLLALALMLPLLAIYANFIGIFSGMIVTTTLQDVTVPQYLYQTMVAIDWNDITVGLVKSVAYGIIVATAGCLRGIQSGSSASAVGNAATSAAVTAIVFIVVADALFAVLFNILHL